MSVVRGYDLDFHLFQSCHLAPDSVQPANPHREVGFNLVQFDHQVHLMGQLLYHQLPLLLERGRTTRLHEFLHHLDCFTVLLH